MGDVVGDLALAGDEVFDAFEHVVEVAGKVAEFNGVAFGGLDAFAKVAVNDASRCAGDARDGVGDVAAHEEGAEEGGDEEDAGDEVDHVEHAFEQAALAAGVIADGERVLVIDGGDEHADGVAAGAAAALQGVNLAEVGQRDVEEDEAVALEGLII